MKDNIQDVIKITFTILVFVMIGVFISKVFWPTRIYEASGQLFQTSEAQRTVNQAYDQGKQDAFTTIVSSVFQYVNNCDRDSQSFFLFANSDSGFELNGELKDSIAIPCEDMRNYASSTWIIKHVKPSSQTGTLSIVANLASSTTKLP